MSFTKCSSRFFGSFLVGMLLTGSLLGQEKPVRLDMYGDALPEGAVARLGTSRLQHAGRIHALVIDPEGKLLISAGQDKAIRIWDIETGRSLMTVDGHDSAVRALALVPRTEKNEPPLLVSGSTDRTIRFWNLATAKALPRIINHPGEVAALAISPDGKHLASGSSRDSHIFLWRISDGKEIGRWRAHAGGTVALAFSPDGQLLASGGQAKNYFERNSADDDYALALWDFKTGKKAHAFDGHTQFVRAVAFAPDGKTLVSAGFDATTGRGVRLWDTAEKKHKHQLKVRFGGGVDSHCVAISPDSKTVAAVDFSGIVFWDALSGAELRPLPYLRSSKTEVLVFSPDGKSLGAAGEEGNITLWDVENRVQRHNGTEGHSQSVSSVAVSPDGQYVATGSFDGTARLWERATGKPVREYKGEKRPGGGLVWCVAFAPDGQSLALSHQREGITVWDVKNAELKRQLKQNYNRITSIAFSPTGKTLASDGIDDKDAHLWNLETGEILQRFRREFERGGSLAYAADGETIATGGKGLIVWDVVTGKPLYRKNVFVKSVAYSPDALLLATVMENGVVVRETASGQELARLGGGDLDFLRLHHSAWQSVAFAHDGRSLALAEANRIRIWELNSRRQVGVYQGHRGSITSIAFARDGSLVSGSEDFTAMVWDAAALLPKNNSSNDPEKHWAELVNADRLKAYDAFCRLRQTPKETVFWLSKGKRLAVAAKEATNQQADAESLEHRRLFWTIRLLESIATPEARQVLKQIADDAPPPWLTRQIQKALLRLTNGVTHN